VFVGFIGTVDFSSDGFCECYFLRQGSYVSIITCKRQHALGFINGMYETCCLIVKNKSVSGIIRGIMKYQTLSKKTSSFLSLYRIKHTGI